MSALCDLKGIAAPKFDEAGRQKSLDRLNIVETCSEEPFERIVDLVKTTLSVPICAVSLIDNDRQWFKAFRGLSVNQTPRDIAFCNHAIAADGPFIVPDATRDPLFAENPLVLDAPHIRSYLGIPLKMPDGYLIGTLCVIDIKPRDFSQQEIDIVASFASLVVGELELRTAASIDALTKLMSRKAWSDRVTEEVDRASRAASGLSILFLDLDHFKAVNDTFGHDVGDMVLGKVARAVRDTLRKDDLLGRIGGEEFAACLTGAPDRIVATVAERIRADVEDMKFAEYQALSCTLSVGIAHLQPGETFEDIMKRADEALYVAKSEGRNCVRLG